MVQNDIKNYSTRRVFQCVCYDDILKNHRWLSLHWASQQIISNKSFMGDSFGQF